MQNAKCEVLLSVGGPKISPFGFSETSLGAEVRVVCIASLKDCTLTWFKDDRELHDGDDGISIQEFQGMLVLTIARVRSEHSGNYTCTGRNADGVGGFSAVLAVPYPPSWETVPEKRVVVSRSSKSTMLTCEASGSPEPRVSWTKQGGTTTHTYTYISHAYAYPHKNRLHALMKFFEL